MPRPRVSVAVSTYCGEELIASSIEGLEAQTIADDLEIIVIDSGSPENEGAIVERLQRAYSNIVYLRTERETLYGSLNRALEVATGDYFANVNIDDWLRPDTLELFAEALDEYEEADLAYSHWAMTNAPGSAPSPETTMRNCMHPPYVPALPLFYCYSGCVQFWRRSTALSLGGYDATLSAAGDLDISSRQHTAGPPLSVRCASPRVSGIRMDGSRQHGFPDSRALAGRATPRRDFRSALLRTGSRAGAVIRARATQSIRRAL